MSYTHYQQCLYDYLLKVWLGNFKPKKHVADQLRYFQEVIEISRQLVKQRYLDYSQVLEINKGVKFSLIGFNHGLYAELQHENTYSGRDVCVIKDANIFYKNMKKSWKNVNNQEVWSDFYNRYLDDPGLQVEMRGIYNTLIELQYEVN